jgi:hypothetical protein
MFIFNLILIFFRAFSVFRPLVSALFPSAFKSRVLNRSDLLSINDFFNTWERYGFECSFDSSVFIEEQFAMYYSTGFDVVNSFSDFYQVYGFRYFFFIKIQIMLYFNLDFDTKQLRKVYDVYFHEPFQWEYIGDFSHDEICGGCINCSPKTFI